MVYMRPYPRFVKGLYLVQHVTGQGRKVRSSDVLLNLRRALGTRYGTRHRRIHENPAQGHLRHGPARRHEFPQFLHDRQARLVVEAGKRFATVKGLTMTVELAMIFR